jgi:putative DNA primase/helicase
MRNFDKVPDELKVLKQWVCWKYGKKKPDGRFDKLPCEANSGRELKWGSPENWLTFKEAFQLWQINQAKIAGVGFVFTEQDPYCGVDFDTCLVHGKLSALATERVKLLASYTEISVSGTGVHTIVRAPLPKTIKDDDHAFGVEAYDHGRFFTVTGEHFNGTPLEISDASVFIAHLSEQYEELMQSKKVEKKKSRSNDSFSKAGKLRKLGLSAEQIKPILIEDNAKRETPLPKKKVAAMADRVEEQYLPGPDTRDIANADLFAKLAGDGFRWVVPWKSWLKWNGTFWQEDREESLRYSCEIVSRELLQRAVALATENGASAKKAFSWAIESGSLSRIRAIDIMARPRLIAPVEKLDANTNLFACANGVLDLSTGTLRPGQKEDWITRHTTVAYNADAQCPQFETFLEEIMQGDKEMIAYLWRVIGYCLTGSTKERAFFIFYGHGRNGKTTFLEVVKAMLGQYAQSARASMILEKNQVQTGANDDVARTVSARLVEITELSGRSTLDAATVTALTGSDRISARVLNANLFEFKPAFKLFIVTNHIPKINDSSNAIWHRLHKVPFDYKVPAERVDKDLTEKLLGELEGVLARAVQACLEWQRDGLLPTEKVVKSGEDLKQEMDLLGQALADILSPDAGTNERTLQEEVYREFKLWADKNGYKRDRTTSRQLTEYMKERGFKHVNGSHNKTTWTNARLRDWSKPEPAIEYGDAYESSV